MLTSIAAFAIGKIQLARFLVDWLRMPMGVAAYLVAAIALVATASVLLARALVLRGAPWSGVFAFAAAWVSAEYLASLGVDGTSAARAYSQMNCLPVVQLASVTGLWGVSFVLALFAAGLAVGIHRRDRAMLGGTAATAIAVFAWGYARESSAAPPSSGTLRVGQAAIPETRAAIAQVLSGEPAGAGAILDAYEEQIDALARQGAAVVVLPEEIVGAPAGEEAAIVDRLSRAAARDGVTIVAGVRLVASPAGHNVAYVLGPTGALAGIYVKEHLVPGFEIPSLAPGHELLLVEAPARAGVAICKDMDFPDPARRYAESDVALLYVPAWDFHEDGWLHGRMAIMRSVELGLPLVRSAQGGRLTANDAFGRVLAEAVTGDAPTSQVVDMPTGRVRTVYARFGNGVPLVTLGLLAAVLARLAWLVRARPARPTS
jgi:apolipoprotein N-acyltransferase